MVDAGEAVDIGRSLLVGVALDQLRLRSRPIVLLCAVIAGAGLLGALFLDDVLRVVAVVVLLGGLVALVVVLIARFLAGRVLTAIAPPAQVADHRDAIQDAIDHVEVLVIPSSEADQAELATKIERGTRKTLGERMRIDVRMVADIPPAASGKMRAIWNRLH